MKKWLALVLLFPAAAHPALYKCRDVTGQIRYSDKVCGATGSEPLRTKKRLPADAPGGQDYTEEGEPGESDARAGHNYRLLKSKPGSAPDEPEPESRRPADPPGEAVQPAAAESPAPRRAASASSGGIMEKVFSLFSSVPKSPPPDLPPMPQSPQEAMEAAKSAYTCKGKIRCEEMDSCEEANYYLMHCPGGELDPDGNGIPCEEQLCR